MCHGDLCTVGLARKLWLSIISYFYFTLFYYARRVHLTPVWSLGVYHMLSVWGKRAATKRCQSDAGCNEPSTTPPLHTASPPLVMMMRLKVPNGLPRMHYSPPSFSSMLFSSLLQQSVSMQPLLYQLCGSGPSKNRPTYCTSYNGQNTAENHLQRVQPISAFHRLRQRKESEEVTGGDQRSDGMRTVTVSYSILHTRLDTA